MISRFKQAIGTCMLAGALLSTVGAHAATYYVATTGNNSNPGTSASPWRTVAYAVSKMVAGDTTYVKGGVYNEGFITFRRSGTQSAPIKLLNAPGQYPVIDCIDKTKYHRINIQNDSGSKYPIGWISIEGLEIRDCYYGIKFYNLHNSTIQRNWIHHNISSGIFGAGATRVRIERNRINHNGTSTYGGHGLYMHGSYYTIVNNLIYDNWNYGIQLNGTVGYDSSKHSGQEYARSNNWIIANNTLAYQKNAAGLVVWGSTCNSARIENNIFYENGVTKPSYAAQGINFISTTCTGTQVRNNLAFASGSGGMAFIAGGTKGIHYTESGSIVNTLNPKFVNASSTLPSSPNFSLALASPAINKGLSTSATSTSYTNISRPQQSFYDIGAFEFFSSTASLGAPTSLQLAK